MLRATPPAMMGTTASPRNAVRTFAMLALAPPPPPALVAPASAPCDAGARARLLAPPEGGDDTVVLACSVRLNPGEHVARRIVIEGGKASGIELDCNGASIGQAEPALQFPRFTVEIRSVVAPGTAQWDRPERVTLRNCAIEGHVRVWGMGVNGQGEAVRESSHAPGHTARAQAAAPRAVSVIDTTITAQGGIPLYLGPGVTGFTLAGSRLRGRSSAVALYLDAESGGNRIAGNDIAVETGRETIAVDGSAGNRITGNRIAFGWRGAVRLYRNCGEGGTVRHQTPSDNVVTGNVFHRDTLLPAAAITVGSRGGWGLHCGEDAGYPFGSSVDDGDHATGNLVEPNTTE